MKNISHSLDIEIQIDAGPPARVRMGRCVAAIVDRWPGDGYCYLKCRTPDGAQIIFRREEPQGVLTWMAYRHPSALKTAENRMAGFAGRHQ